MTTRGPEPMTNLARFTWRLSLLLGLFLGEGPAAAQQGSGPQTAVADTMDPVDRQRPHDGPLRPEAIPARPKVAPTGSQFAKSTTGVGGAERQRRALVELRRGNLPEFMREFQPIHLEHVTGSDTLRAVIWVAPDYLAVGSTTDFLRIPLTYSSAAKIATEFGCLLPTRRIVDAVYAQAQVHLKPSPMTPGPRMRSSDYYQRHQNTIEKQILTAGATRDKLVAGHKKDVVLTNRLLMKPGRIAIYGWQRPGGRPIQPLSTVHDAEYADYSHGLRLVYGEGWVDGRWRPLMEILADPVLAPLLTYEGVLESPGKLMRRRQGSD